MPFATSCERVASGRPRSLGAASTVHDRFQAWVEAGVLLAMGEAGLKQYDMKRVEATLASPRVIGERPEDGIRHLCGDKGYDYDAVREIVKAWGYVGHIPPRDERDDG